MQDGDHSDHYSRRSSSDKRRIMSLPSAKADHEELM